ncbi:MAG: threonylcarbamoyl-AMP synthase [Bdellovibrionales bacterium]|nr:threonylcarbamoyl-AMP synthase [Bdellovibrionales bacterium]
MRSAKMINYFTMILKSSQKSLSFIIETLNNNTPVVIPTETVYGLAARIDQPEALKKIFSLKKRPFFDPLIVHIYDTKQVQLLSHFESPILTQLTTSFWPGPLTLVLPKSNSVNPIITSGLDSVGIRMPNHPIALKVLEAVKVPLAAPSANLFGHTSPTKATHVEKDFNLDSLLILNGGDCSVGIESTVLKISKNESNSKIELSILRKGFITKSKILEALSSLKDEYTFASTIDKKSSPGHMKHHYMPSTPLIFLEKKYDIQQLLKQIESDFLKIPERIEEIEIKKPLLPIKKWGILKFSENPELACRQLYSELQKMSEKNFDILIFNKEPYMNSEPWEGFLERLSKAASLTYN